MFNSLHEMFMTQYTELWNAVARTARGLLPVVEAASDEPTADILVQRLTVHEQTAWMLRSLLEA